MKRMTALYYEIYKDTGIVKKDYFMEEENGRMYKRMLW